MASLLRATGPFRHSNVRWYSWFTIAFNARFYYPILAILFLDLGLTLAQFVTLNAIWAATIFLAEVPSGALADLIGRRKLLIAAGALMILEMTVLLLAPKDAGIWLFVFCAVNRVLSGLAEASASGADEALAYDTLQEQGEEESWDDVLETMMRWRSGAMIIAMVSGAMLYEFFPRLPIIFCLGQAVIAFIISLKFRDPESTKSTAGFSEVFAQTWQAAKWVFTTKAAILLVVGGLVIDGVARNFATINSEYYRLISIPTVLFGVIAAATAALGVFLPKLSKVLVRKYSPLTNLTLLAGWMVLNLIGLAQTWDHWGVLPAIGIMAGLYHLGFVISRNLNALASSGQRATVLSVKGLLFNLGYGGVSLIFAGVVSYERGRTSGDDEAFTAALGWQPLAFAAVFVTYFMVAKVMRMPLGKI